MLSNFCVFQKRFVIIPVDSRIACFVFLMLIEETVSRWFVCLWNETLIPSQTTTARHASRQLRVTSAFDGRGPLLTFAFRLLCAFMCAKNASKRLGSGHLRSAANHSADLFTMVTSKNDSCSFFQRTRHGI